MLHVDDSPPTVKISKAMRSAAMSHIEASMVDDSGTSGTFSYYVSSGPTVSRLMISMMSSSSSIQEEHRIYHRIF
ncbi:hypothetical protein V1478_014505, partial [Vespula squamosa]